ncbi:hypothetical protein U1Q18_009782 [Sarracenia purpurea var. burkii]
MELLKRIHFWFSDEEAGEVNLDTALCFRRKTQEIINLGKSIRKSDGVLTHFRFCFSVWNCSIFLGETMGYSRAFESVRILANVRCLIQKVHWEGFSLAAYLFCAAEVALTGVRGATNGAKEEGDGSKGRVGGKEIVKPDPVKDGKGGKFDSGMVAPTSREEEVKSDEVRAQNAVSLDRNEVSEAPSVAKVHSTSTETRKIEDEDDYGISDVEIEDVSSDRGGESSIEESSSEQEGSEREIESGENEQNEQGSVVPQIQFQEDRDSECSKETDASIVSGSDKELHDATDWFRVRKRRNGKKIRRQEKSKFQVPDGLGYPEPVACGGNHVPRHGTEQSRAQGPVRLQPMIRPHPVRPAPGVQIADVVGYSAPPLSPAAQASLLVKAIEG